MIQKKQQSMPVVNTVMSTTYQLTFHTYHTSESYSKSYDKLAQSERGQILSYIPISSTAICTSTEHHKLGGGLIGMVYRLRIACICGLLFCIHCPTKPSEQYQLCPRPGSCHTLPHLWHVHSSRIHDARFSQIVQYKA